MRLKTVEPSETHLNGHMTGSFHRILRSHGGKNRRKGAPVIQKDQEVVTDNPDEGMRRGRIRKLVVNM
jgi:hypothetical protein